MDFETLCGFSYGLPVFEKQTDFGQKDINVLFVLHKTRRDMMRIFVIRHFDEIFT